MTCEEKYDALKREFDQFVYIVSHDFSAPLRAISNLSDWIQEDLKDFDHREVQDNLALIQDRANRLLGMVEGARRISRVSGYDIAIAEFDVRKELDALIEANVDPTIVFRIDGEFTTINSYKTKFIHIFEELFMNSIRFKSAENAAIHVHGEVTDDSMIITVTDNGIGIQEQALEKITRLYYTALPKEAAESTGVGLHYIEKVLQFVGGSMKITSQENIETCVTITWPIKH